MNEELFEKILAALHSRDFDSLDRLHRAFVAEQLQWAKEGHVATARLLYFNGVDIDPVFCDFLQAPPKRFPPPPRRVWRRGNWGETIALRIMLIPLLIILGVLGFNLCEEALLHLFGQEVQGHVTALRRDDHRKGPTFHASYSFIVNGTHFGTEQEVWESRFKKLTVNDAVPVKTRIIRGERRYEPAFSAWESTPWPMVGGLLMLSLFSGALIWGAWLEPYRIARVIREGVVTEGTINKVQPNQKNSQQTVNFTFTLAGGDVPLRGSSSGPNRPLAQLGQNVTVFYDPAKPKSNVAYEFCEFETDALTR